jgi:hypothetical protein
VAAGSTFGLARCSHRRFYRVLNPRAGRLWPRSILTALPHVKNEVSSPLSTHTPRSFTSLIVQLSERDVSASLRAVWGHYSAWYVGTGVFHTALYALVPVSRRHYPDYEVGEDNVAQQEMRIGHLHPEVLHLVGTGLLWPAWGVNSQ